MTTFKKILLFIFFMLFVVNGKVQAATLSGGNAVISRSDLDSRTNFTLVDTNNPLNANGRVEQWSIFVKMLAKVQLKIFRKIGSDYTVVGQSSLITPSLVDGIQTYSLNPPITVDKDDLVGLYFETSAVVPFTLDNGSYARGDLLGKTLFTNSGENPQPGQVAGFDDSSDRTYSIAVSGTVEYRVDDDFLDCPKADYSDIQTAVSALSAGETVYVCRGTYQGPVDIVKQGMKIISLEGSQKTYIEAGLAGNGFEFGFRIKNKNVLIQGFTIKNADNVAKAVGVIVGANKVDPPTSFSSDNAEIVSNIFDHNNYHIYIWKASGVELTNNIFQNGVQVGAEGAAVKIWDGTGSPAAINNNEITSNVFKDNQTAGVVIGSSSFTLSSGNKISNNVFDKSGDGFSQLELFRIGKTDISNNVFKESGGAAIVLNGADENLIEQNQIINSKGGGIILKPDGTDGSDKNRISSMVINHTGSANLADGILLANKATSNEISLVKISGSSRDGIRAASGTRKNLIERNIITGSGQKDARDLSPNLPPAQRNIWRNNICQTQSPTGLCLIFGLP